VKLYWTGTSVSTRDQELEKARAVCEAGLPVPAVLDCVEYEGRPGIVYERVYGPSMGRLALRQPWQTPGLGRQLAELHVALHRCAVPGIPTPGIREALRRRIEGPTGLPRRLTERVLRQLAELPLDPEVRLCHGDFHPLNIIMAERGPVIIDWIDALNADPTLDVARTLLLMKLAPNTAQGLARVGLSALLRVFVKSYLGRYLELRPLDQGAIEDWQLPLAVSRITENVKGEARVLPEMIEAMLR